MLGMIGLRIGGAITGQAGGYREVRVQEPGVRRIGIQHVNYAGCRLLQIDTTWRRRSGISHPPEN
jgi:hypothetical protein